VNCSFDFCRFDLVSWRSIFTRCTSYDARGFDVCARSTRRSLRAGMGRAYARREAPGMRRRCTTTNPSKSFCSKMGADGCTPGKIATKAERPPGFPRRPQREKASQRNRRQPESSRPPNARYGSITTRVLAGNWRSRLWQCHSMRVCLRVETRFVKRKSLSRQCARRSPRLCTSSLYLRRQRLSPTMSC